MSYDMYGKAMMYKIFFQTKEIIDIMHTTSIFIKGYAFLRWSFSGHMIGHMILIQTRDRFDGNKFNLSFISRTRTGLILK